MDNPSSFSKGEKDNLFQKNIYPRSGFVFDKRVADVFDNMLHRSIPYYQEVMNLSRNFLLLQGPGGVLYDIGSSTGNFLLNLATHDTQNKFQEYWGIDNSNAMVKKAEMKLQEQQKQIHKNIKIKFLCSNLFNHDYISSGAFVLHYTLQFVDPKHRKELLQKLFSALIPGGLMVLSEKVEEKDSQLKKFFINRYHNFKTVNQYTIEEIARKKEALEKVLIPSSTNEYINLLQKTGFREVAIAFKWYNFATMFAIK